MTEPTLKGEQLSQALISASKWGYECEQRIEDALFELKQARKEMNDLASQMFNELEELQND
jgi:hypothetical protein